MSVTICLPLFGNAGQELEEGERLDGPRLRRLSADLQERLGKAADLLDKLTVAGWSCQVAMYDVILSARGVSTREQAESALRALGVDPEGLMIVEDVDEEEVEGDLP
jgi:hypothetical protein